MSTRIVLIGAGSAQLGFDMRGDVFLSTLLADAVGSQYRFAPEALAARSREISAPADQKAVGAVESEPLSGVEIPDLLRKSREVDHDRRPCSIRA